MNSVTQNTVISNEVVAVKFYDDTLITLEKDGEHYVAVRPIVENMGLDWKVQHRKLMDNPKFNCGHMTTVAKDGKIREVLCMPIKKLNGWLFSINPEKVRADIRHIVEQYQEECFTVLHDYWHKGVAVNERMVVNTPILSTVKDRNGLVKTCEWFVRVASCLDYSEVYNLVHHRFNVGKLSELTTEQVGQATEYLQGLLLQTIARQRGFNSRDLTPLAPMHRTDVGKFYDGALWTRMLEPDEQIVRTKDIPQLIINEPYIDNETLTAINYASSARLASMLKNPPFLTTLDKAKEV